MLNLTRESPQNYAKQVQKYFQYLSSLFFCVGFAKKKKQKLKEKKKYLQIRRNYHIFEGTQGDETETEYITKGTCLGEIFTRYSNEPTTTSKCGCWLNKQTTTNTKNGNR